MGRGRPNIAVTRGNLAPAMLVALSIFFNTAQRLNQRELKDGRFNQG
jgi:hypothetical protein